MNGAVDAIAKKRAAAADEIEQWYDCASKGRRSTRLPPVNSTALSGRLRLRRYQLEFVCHSAKLGQGVDAHLPHQMAAMDLHRDF